MGLLGPLLFLLFLPFVVVVVVVVIIGSLKRQRFRIQVLIQKRPALQQ